MKECVKCKTQLEDDELFCHECGTKQEIEEVDAQVDEVQESGGKKCIHCGETIEYDSLFCPFCGMQQDVEDVKDEDPQKEIEKEEPQQEPVEPEPLQELEEKAPQQETVEQKSLQEPEEEAPQQEPVEPEQVQTDEQDFVLSPQPESSEQLEQPKQSEQREMPEAEEQSTYEREEEKKSKNWLWILLTLLIAGAAGWYFFIQDSGNTPYEPQVDTDMIEEVADSVYDDEAMDDDMPTSAIEFLEQFYKGKVGDADYLAENVTTNVMIKLKEDYVYDCPSNDCLAVWVFTAYPPGSDMELEEGPIISETFTKDKYRVDFKYAFYHGTQQENEIRTVYLFVSELDGKYMITDYEVVNDGNGEEQETDMKSDDVESQMKSSSENTHEEPSNSMQDIKLYKALFAFGTIEELKENGVLSDDGKLNSNLDKNFFTQIDIRTDKVIKLYSKSAKIVTTHPVNSYTLKPDVNNLYILTINDPQLFWSTSRYLVIIVK